MNIEDVIQTIKVPSQIVLTIFDLQRTLMVKYDEIERRNGVCVPEAPFSIDDRRVQYRIKDLFWRFTEELSEASEELINNSGLFDGMLATPEAWNKQFQDSKPIRHFLEEVVDALHFLTEASIVADLDPKKIQSMMLDCELLHREGMIKPNKLSASLIEHLMYHNVVAAGLAANCLKNKPWKVSEMPTDKNKFKVYMSDIWGRFFQLWFTIGGSSSQMYVIYNKKNIVNTWRQDTKY